MPRDNPITTTQNETGQLGNVASLTPIVAAAPIGPHNTVQTTGASRMAGQLADALGVVQKLAADANTKD